MDFKNYILRQKAIISGRSKRAEKERKAEEEENSTERDCGQNNMVCGDCFGFSDSERLFGELDNLTGLNTRERLAYV